MTATQPFSSNLIMSNLKWFKYELIWNKNHGKAPGLAKYRPMPSHESILIFGRGKTKYNPQMTEGKPYSRKEAKPRPDLAGNERKLGYTQSLPTVNTGWRYPISVLTFPSPMLPGQHPTQKPIPLFEYLVKTYTDEGDIVLDPCVGSGTTALAAKNTNRNFICFEQDKKWFDVAAERLKQTDTLPSTDPQ